MANLKYITTVLAFNVFYVVFAGVMRREPSLRDFSRRILDGPAILPEEPFPRTPWLPPWTAKPPTFTFKPIDFTFKPIDFTITPPDSQRSNLDLAFIMDSTGSMSPYINNVRQHIRDLVDAIVASSSTNLRLALIEYRDHKPEDLTFVTRKHDFTRSVWTMKSWLTAARASGGGDKPEAVAEAMHDATTLSWRNDAAKISVLISDAPPHGLVPSEDNSFPGGSPNGHDPIDLARKLAKRGITLYTVGCEPSIVPYKDFFMALAYLTGGQYIPLSVPHFLTDAIIGSAKEELSLKKFASDVQKEIKSVTAAGGTVNEQQITQNVFNKLKSEGAKATQLMRNNKPLEGATAEAKAIAASTSMADVRKIFKKGTSTGTFRTGSISSLSDIRRRLPSFSGGLKKVMPSRPSSLDSFSMASGGGMSGTGESFATVEGAVSLDQIGRLVKQEAAKLSV